jgi:hypothetical protein
MQSRPSDAQRAAVLMLSTKYMVELPMGLVRVGDVRAYYTGKGNIAQRCNIPLAKKFPKREDKLRFLSELFRRKITSTKDLTFAEARALAELGDVLC